MFQHTVDEIVKDVPNVFGIVDDILVVGYNSDDKDHDEILRQVLQVCKHVNLKLNKDKCNFRCTVLVPKGNIASIYIYGSLPLMVFGSPAVIYIDLTLEYVHADGIECMHLALDEVSPF